MISVKFSNKFINGLYDKHKITYDETFKKEYVYSGGNSSDIEISQYKILNNNKPLPPHENECICGRGIMKNYYIKNIVSEKILVIGSECIRNFLDFTITKKIPCSMCFKFVSSNRLKQNRCNSCISGYCHDCGGYSTGKNGTIYKKCYKCLIAYKKKYV